MRNRYCDAHHQHEAICAVKACSLPVEPGHRTCSSPECRPFEARFFEKGQAMFQMKARYARLQGSSHPANSLLAHSSIEPPEDGAQASAVETYIGSNPVVLEAPQHGPVTALNIEELDTRQPGVLSALAAVHSDSQPSRPTPSLAPNAKDCEGKSSKGNHTRRAEFGQRLSHNEQLAVTSCGLIIGRKTFVGSESPTNVLASLVHIVSVTVAF
jgi:hypothetical protein